MKRLILAGLALAFGAVSQAATVTYNPATGVLLYPVNFFEINSNLIVAAISGAFPGTGSGNASTNVAQGWSASQTFNGPLLMGNTNLASKISSLESSVGGKQAADPDLDDLADGSLTGSKVGSGIDDDNVSFDDADSVWTATTIGAALEEMNDSINSGVPNGTGAKVHWSQLLGVPAGFADGTDDGAGGGGTNSWKIDVNNVEVTEPSLDDTPTVSWDVTGSSITAIVPTGSITTNHLNPAAIAFFASAANSALTGTPTVNGTNLMALLNAKIDSDPDLVAISALTGTGLLARTGAGTYAERTLTGDAEITVANGNGVSGNPTLAIGAAIARVAAMAATYQPLHAVLTRLSGIGLGTSGDVLIRDANGWTNLAKGSDGQVLKLSSGLPAWGTDSTSGGGAGDVYTTSNNVQTGTNTYTKSLLVSNTVENHEIVFVGTNATAGTSKNAGHLGVWDNGDGFGALRLASTDGHLRLQVTSTNLEAHTGFNFTNAPRSQWIVHRDASGNGETYQEGRGPNMAAGGDASEYYRLCMKALGFHLMTGKGGIEFAPTSGLVRIQGPGTAFVAPPSGAGIEFFYDSTNALWGSGGAGRGAISVYSRDTSTFGDLRLNARQTRIQNSGTDAFIVTNSLVIVTNAALRVGITNVTDELALKAPLASPALTGNPTVPTASPGDNDTSAASTAFVTAAVAAGGGGGINTNFLAGQTIASFTAPQAHAPASNPASYGTRNAIPVLEFDPSTQEQSRWVINLPVGYAASAATVLLRWTTTATSGDGRMGARFWRVTGVDVDTDDFATAVEATTTCSATAGTTVSTTLSAVNLDGLAGGEVGILEVYRDTGDAADTINSNDIQLMSVEVRAE